MMRKMACMDRAKLHLTNLILPYLLADNFAPKEDKQGVSASVFPTEYDFIYGGGLGVNKMK